MSAPLPPNINQPVGVIDGAGNLTPVSFEFTNGVDKVTDQDATQFGLAVNTDAHGNIIQWGFYASSSSVYVYSFYFPDTDSEVGFNTPSSGGAYFDGYGIPTGSWTTIATVDPAPDLLQVPSYAVTSDPERLAVGGRMVQGVAADGVAQVLIRIPSSTPGEQFELKIQEADVPTKLGALGPIGTNPCASQGVNDISVVSQALQSGQAEAFALYCAPLDYASSILEADSSTSSRLLHIQATSTSGSSPDQTLELNIVRPKVIFLHGFNSEASSWMPILSQLTAYVQIPGVIDRVEYGYKIGRYLPTNPELPRTAFSEIIHSQLGFESNASVARDQILLFMNSYRSGYNPALVPIAAAQADVVGHSMGGLVARTLPVSSDTKPDYYSATNYGQGLIHKLITLGTPHLGTPQAISILQGPNSCSTYWASFAGTYSFFSVEVGGKRESGATSDLQGDGTGGFRSPALEQLSSDMPIAYGAGEVGTQTDYLNHANLMQLIRGICGSTTVLPDGTSVPGLELGEGNRYQYGEPTADRWTPERWSTQFDPNVLLDAPPKTSLPTPIFPQEGPGSSVPTENDASVPLTSALNGLSPSDPAVTVFRNTVHSPGWTSLGFAGPNLQTSPEVAHWIDLLLNAPLSDPRFHRP